MLSNCSLLVVCLLGCSVVQGYTHAWRGKAPLRETRSNASKVSSWLSTLDMLFVDLVKAVPSCESALATFKSGLLAIDNHLEKLSAFAGVLGALTKLDRNDPEAIEILCSSM